MVIRNGNLQGCCPFHKESRPSWGISLTEPHLHGCFSCGASGNLFSLLVRIGGYSVSAAKALVGDTSSEGERKFPTLQTPLVQGASGEYFDPRLLWIFSSDRAYRYLWSRGIPLRVSKKARVCYDHFARRVLFPWYYGGKLRGVTGRSVISSEKVKTLPYFNTKKGDCLYLPAGRIVGQPIILVEGEVDALKVFSAGFQNVGALGFGSFTERQSNLVLNSGATEVALFFDNDTTGSRLLDKATKVLSNKGLPIRYVPYSFCREEYSALNKLDPGVLSLGDIRRCIAAASLANWPGF